MNRKRRVSDCANDYLRPVAEQYGEAFRLHARCNGTRDPSFRGTYPYITGDPDDGTRMGSFSHWDDRESISRRLQITATNSRTEESPPSPREDTYRLRSIQALNA